MIKKQLGFTMLELIMVIVVLGILAALALPKLDKDFTQEAADNVLSNMRYTQHMALMADRQKYDDIQWQKSFWQISFQTCSDGALFLSIGSDTNYNGSLDQNETVIDPATGKTMYWDKTSPCADIEETASTSPLVFLSAKYGVKTISRSGSCNAVTIDTSDTITSGNANIGFDHLGRLHVDFSNNDTPNYSSYINSNAPCSFTFDLENDESFTIDILPETGSMKIRGQKNS